jgi:hypothetical protein
MEHTTGLQKLFEVSDSDALAALPETFRDFSSELLEAYEAQPRAVVATALATTAAALGSYATVVVPQSGRRVTMGFNVVVCIHGSRTPGWIDLLRAPLLGPIFDMQLLLGEQGLDVAQKRINQSVETLAAARRANPDPDLLKDMEQEIARQRAGLRPSLLSNRFTPAHLERVIDGCFDGAVMLTDPAGDPVESFLAMKAGDQRDLVRLLNCSWQGLPLTFDQRVRPGSISMFWVTQEEMLLPLGDTAMVAGALPPPVLWMGSPVNRLRSTKPGIPSEKVWKKVIEVLFNYRCQHRTEAFQLSDEAEVVLSQFEREIEASFATDGTSQARHLIWLPELARRVAVVCTVLNGGAVHDIPADAATAAVLVVRWMAAEHLRVLVAFDAGPVSPGADMSTATDRSDPAEVMLRKILEKAPVTRRKLWRSYNDPKVHSFQAVLDGLLRDGKVAKDISERFVPVESGGSATVMAVE